MSEIKSVCMKNVARLGGFLKFEACEPLAQSAMAASQVLSVARVGLSPLQKQHSKLPSEMARGIETAFGIPIRMQSGYDISEARRWTVAIEFAPPIGLSKDALTTGTLQA
jgi:plasmid maintenance system antidote protein VapI